MCAIFGFLDYKGILSNATMKKLINALAVNAESKPHRGRGEMLCPKFFRKENHNEN